MVYLDKFREYVVGGAVIGATVGISLALGGGQYASYSGDNFILDLNETLRNARWEKIKWNN